MSQIVMGAGIGYALVNAQAAGGFKAKCDVADKVACTLALLSFAAAGLDLTAKEEAGKTKSAVTAGSGNFNSGFGGDVGGYDGGQSGLSLEEQGLLLEVNKEIASLEKKGYKVDPKTGTVTTPEGKFPASAFANGKAMADAGLISADQIGDVDAMIKKALNDSPKVISMGIGGGGGGSSNSGSRTSSYTYNDPYKSLYGQREKPNDPRTTGLTRTLASGDSIGSSTDNLFEMIKRRYQQKSAEKMFVGQ